MMTADLRGAELLFALSIALLAYLYVGYPLLVAGWAAMTARPERHRPHEPTVSIVIAAHSEAGRIEQKLENLLSLDYPADRLEILVGSDGSTDGTAERARAVADPRIRIFSFITRGGKPRVLNTLIPQARGEIVVLADVRQWFDQQVLHALVQSFGDPRVGAVSGELILTPSPAGSAVGDGASFYWRYEKFIRCHESRVDSTVGATGAIYAMRKSLFQSIPDDTILDDVLIPARIARRGYRVLFEPRARAYGYAPATSREEFTRKVRTLAGNFQLFARERWLLNPIQNRLWFQTVSHKGLRLLMPLLQTAALAANLALADQALVYKATLLTQALFYAAALSSYLLRYRRTSFWPSTVPYMVCLMGWATVVGFTRFLTGHQTVMWEKPVVEIQEPGPRFEIATTGAKQRPL